MRARRHAFAVAVAAVLLAGFATSAYAEDRVVALTRMLRSSSDKTRLSAVLALAKLGDRKVEKPLVVALGDKSVRVRMVAATALGRLDCEAALPALRRLADGDDDDAVRSAASNAALKIKASRERSDAEARRSTVAARARSDAPHADLYLRINSSTDDAPGRPDVAARRTRAEIVRRTLADQIRREGSITQVPADAQRWGLAARHIDVSVTRLEAVPAGGYMEVAAQLRLAISDEQGKMLSFLTGGAKVQVPVGKYDPSTLPSLQKEALEGAMRGMFGKLLAHLRTDPQMVAR